MTEIFQHPSIGAIRGKRIGSIVQFLGLKYASLKNRLSVPEIIEEYNESIIDATKIGPQVISPINACDIEFGLIQQSLPNSGFAVSEMNGLHLNITAPDDAKNLPVMVFIHGGGFALGSNAWPQYDMSKLVQLAIDMRLSLICVGINYRLGVPGFLTSKELQESGYKANNGIRDQRTALLWVKRNIAGFGGDPNRVTLAGQSAGAVASMLHLQSTEPLFHQLISMSGTPLLLQPLQPIASEEAYWMSVKAMGIEHLAKEERIETIVNGPASEFCEKITPDIPLLPVVDGDILSPFPTFEQFAKVEKGDKAVLPGMEWCHRIMIGDCGFDASIYAHAFANREAKIAEGFGASLHNSLSSCPTAVESLLRSYNISPETPGDIALRNILQFATDIGFFAPVKAIAKAWSSISGNESFIYHVNTPNPWDGPWKNQASHIIETVLLFQNFAEYLPPDHRAQGRKLAEAFIIFITGGNPFPSYQADPTGAMVFGPPAVQSAQFVTGDQPETFGRKGIIWDIAGICGLDALRDAFIGFLTGH